MIDIVAAYVEVRERLLGVVLDSAVDVETPVPACPAWSVRDVVAHLTGGVVDATTGHAPEIFDGMNLLDQWRDDDAARARDALTARQVQERRSRSVAALADEWRQASERLVPILRGETPVLPPLPPFIGAVLVNDIVVHEGDIRAALGFARAPEIAALSLALSGYSLSLEYRIRALRLPALILGYAGKVRRLGDGEAGATVRADRHELVRTLAGRRTRERIPSLDWDGDPHPYLDIMSEYGPVTSPTSD